MPPLSAPLSTDTPDSAVPSRTLDPFDMPDLSEFQDQPAGAAPGKKKKSKKAKKVSSITAPGGPADGGAATAAPAGKPKSRLPLLLGVLGVVVLGAAIFLFLTKDSDDVTTDDTTTESTAAPTTTAAGATTTTAAGAVTTAAPSETTSPGATSEVTVPTTVANAADLQLAFDTEATRACNAIKADPGLFTEKVMVYDQAWAAIGKSYEDLQKAINDCSFQARDEAFKRIDAMNNGG